MGKVIFKIFLPFGKKMLFLQFVKYKKIKNYEFRRND